MGLSVTLVLIFQVLLDPRLHMVHSALQFQLTYWSLSILGGYSVLLGFALLLWGSLSQTCSSLVCQLIFVSLKIFGLDLLLWRVLVCS